MLYRLYQPMTDSSDTELSSISRNTSTTAMVLGPAVFCAGGMEKRINSLPFSEVKYHFRLNHAFKFPPDLIAILELQLALVSAIELEHGHFGTGPCVGNGGMVIEKAVAL